MNAIVVAKPCPKCKTENSIEINQNTLVCTNENCTFKLPYACPICEKGLSEEQFKNTQKPVGFTCEHCKNDIPLQKIKYLIESGLIMDYQNRCSTCNSPLIHRPQMNMGKRCFFFPKCAGQIDMFNTVKESFVFLDFETTGLEVGRDSLIEIGAVKIDEEGLEHPFQSFIAFNNPLPPKIIQITGITDTMLEGAPDVKQVIETFVQFLGNAKIVAHNADFDVPWLITACMQNDIPIPNNDIICTLKWAKKIPEPHCSLGALTKKYKIAHKNAHRALADAVATKELFFVFQDTQKETRPLLDISTFVETSKKLINKYKNLTPTP